MKPANLFLSFWILFICQTGYSQTTFYVSNAGNDAWSGTSTVTPFKTLKRAHDAIPSPLGGICNIILMSNGGEIKIAPLNVSSLEWTKTGTAQYPINIYSESCDRAVITRTNDDASTIIRLLNANYVNFSNIHFKNISKGAIAFDNADYCKIDFCKFSGVDVVAPIPSGHAVIWIGWQYGTTNQKSTGNVISNNLISDIYMNDINGEKHKTHAIYLATMSEFNEIYNNTIFDPTSYAIHFWHENYNDNRASTNIVTMNLAQGVGSLAFALGHDAGESNLYITNNKIVDNYVYDANHEHTVNFTDGMSTSNEPDSDTEEEVSNYLYNSLYPSDPYWLNYDASRITYRMVTGSFSGYYKDQVAALYDNGNGTTNIHVWIPSTDNTYIYENGSFGWWYGSAYTASQTTGRVVAGNINNDAYGDIAAFYDYGNNTTQIHVWKSDGNSFDNPEIWWNTTGYDATKITNRTVSGDFDADGKTDIGAFYDNGDGTTNLHVWISNGTEYDYQYSAGWWGDNSGLYNVNNITGRVIAGDFNGDGKTDIGAFYGYHTNATRLQVWLSTGSGFTFQGTNGWWNSTAFAASQITGRVVSLDYNADGKADIAAFYDNGTGGTNLRVWLSTGTAFTYQGDTGWWNSTTGYDVSNITGRVTTSGSPFAKSINAFYDYGESCGSLRTNVWKVSGSSFNYINESLGFPWLTGFVYDKSLPVGNAEYAEENKNDDPEIIIYPNPAENVLHIKKSSGSETTMLEILDVKGIIVKRIASDKSDDTIEIGELKSGMYLIRLESEGNTELYKFIKE